MAQIICENLRLAYEQKSVLDGLSFTAEKGDYICIIGENGSGKTTLMKTLLGLHSVGGGSLIFGDGLNRGEIGYLPQQNETQKDFPASVREIVLSGCQNKKGLFCFYNKKDKQKAEGIMKKLGILNLSRQSYNRLSGGQQQRVLLARALCSTGQMLLLDEPVSGLDQKATENMYEIIDFLNKEGITVIMISHDVEGALLHAKKILHIGKELFFGTTEQYLAKGEIK